MIYTFGHQFAATDNDSIIASITLSELLKKLGFHSKPVLFNPKGVSEVTKTIFEKMGMYDLPPVITPEELAKGEFVLVDHNDPIESYGKIGINKEPIAIIDHHVDVGTKAQAKIIRRVGSTCTLIAHLYQYFGVPISDQTARALIYGIVCDTKGLKSRKTSPTDIKTVKELMKDRDLKGLTLERVTEDVLISTDVMTTPIKTLLRNSLKEYLDGKVGVATLEVMNDEYLKRLPELQQAAWNTPYPCFILMVFQQASEQTFIYYFNKTEVVFPKEEVFDYLISRSQGLIPNVIKQFQDAEARQGIHV